MKLADALLRRKELQQKVDQVRSVKSAEVFEDIIQRRQANNPTTFCCYVLTTGDGEMSEASVVSPSDDRSGFDAVVMRYRCGWCGRPTLEDGTPIPLIEVGLISNIDEEYKDAEKVNGGCCG